MTSIPYSRFWQPLQFESGWITIGANKTAPKGKKGGVPVKVKDGRIVAGPAALQDRQIGNLKEKPEHKSDDTPVLERMKGHNKHKQYDPESEQGKSEAARKRRAAEGRNETRRANEHTHASRRREVRKAGLNPDQVESAYNELKQHDAEHVAMHNKLIRTAYNALSLTSRSKMLAGEDWASIPGADQVARELSNSEDFQFLFQSRGDETAAAEELYDMMAAGLKKPKDDKALWEEAAAMASEHKPSKSRAEIDAIPFEKFWEPQRFNAEFESKHPRAEDGKFGDKSGVSSFLIGNEESMSDFVSRFNQMDKETRIKAIYAMPTSRAKEFQEEKKKQSGKSIAKEEKTVAKTDKKIKPVKPDDKPESDNVRKRIARSKRDDNRLVRAPGGMVFDKYITFDGKHWEIEKFTGRNEAIYADGRERIAVALYSTGWNKQQYKFSHSIPNTAKPDDEEDDDEPFTEAR